MKRALLAFVVAGLVLLTTGYWFFFSTGEKSSVDLLQFGVIALLVGFGVFFAFRRLSSARRGEPAEDELSRSVMQKTAALSYYISLYLWVFLLFLKDRVAFDTEELLGTGILGMAVTFAACWIIFYFRGAHEK